MIGCLAQYLHLPQEPGHELRFVLRHANRNFEHACAGFSFKAMHATPEAGKPRRLTIR
jgi:hypothetical protein